MSTEMIAVRLTSEQKERLEQLASQRNQTVSDVIRSWIDGDSVMDSVPPELMERIRGEARRRNIPARRLATMLLSAAFDRLGGF
jgi:predicted DNA-binding protein